MNKKEFNNFTQFHCDENIDINQTNENSYHNLFLLFGSMLETLSSLIYSKNIFDNNKSDFVLMFEKVALDKEKHHKKLNSLRFIASEVLDIDVDFSFLMIQESNNISEYYNDICYTFCYVLQIMTKAKYPSLFDRLQEYEKHLDRSYSFSKSYHIININFFSDIFLDLLIQNNH